MVNRGRMKKLRKTLELKWQGECPLDLADTLDNVPERTESRMIASRMMRVSPAYVGFALRIQREAPELFEQLHAGTLTLQEALRILDGESDDPQRQQVKAARSQLNRVLRHLDRHPDFLERFRTFLDEFSERLS